MKNSKVLVIGAIIISVFLLGGSFLLRSNKGSDSFAAIPKNTSDEIAPHYVTFSKDNLAKAQVSGRPVLYFWASWCPTCRVLDQELKEKGNALPNDVTILQVNYDTEKELKKRYGITQQHTLVQIDGDGNEVKKWIGGGVETIKEQLQ